MLCSTERSRRAPIQETRSHTSTPGVSQSRSQEGFPIGKALADGNMVVCSCAQASAADVLAVLEGQGNRGAVS